MHTLFDELIEKYIIIRNLLYKEIDILYMKIFLYMMLRRKVIMSPDSS